MFKVALNAGHYLYESGRRCYKAFDENETREWVLNSRVCEKVEEKLKAYDGYELFRVDDRTGETLIKLEQRAKNTNTFGADIYVSVHHNGGINGGSGGGVMAYTYLKVDDYTKKLQKALYERIIAKTGLKGNRATPLTTADFAECRLTKMPAVLLECGFMDSSTDTPVIITEKYSEQVAEAITEVIAEFGSLTKKPTADKENTDNNESGTLYKVQVGAFSKKENAEKLSEELQNKGYSVIIKKE